MKIPEDAEIAPQKLTGYLLVLRPSDDKSKFLDRAGFTLDNPSNCWTASESLQMKRKRWKMAGTSSACSTGSTGCSPAPMVVPLPSRRCSYNGTWAARSTS